MLKLLLNCIRFLDACFYFLGYLSTLWHCSSFCVGISNKFLTVCYFHIIFFCDCVWQGAILALDTSVLDNDQVENLIKFFPTKEEIEMLKVILSLVFSFHLMIWLAFLISIWHLMFCLKWGSFFFSSLSFHQGYNGNKEMLGKCEQVTSAFWFQHNASFCLLTEALNYAVVLPGANESSTFLLLELLSQHRFGGPFPQANLPGTSYLLHSFMWLGWLFGR